MRLAAFAAGFLLLFGTSAFAAPPMVVQDPSNVNRNMAVNSDGSINVNCGTGCSSTIGAVTVANGADVAEGSTTDSAYSGSGNTTTIGGLKGIYAAATSAIAAGTNTIGGTVPTSSATAGGVTPYTLTAANSTNATNVKASAGQLYHIAVYNNSATLAWVSFYNTAGTPTCGTGIVYQTMIPSNSTSGGGAVEDFATGMAFSTGIGICITTGIAGTGSVAATSYVVGLGYK
jgi:hypothetical protein